MNKKVKYDERHGGAYDRGRADSWYGRGYDPHMYAGGSYDSDRIEMKDMRADEITAYSAGYRDNESDPTARKNDFLKF